MRQSAGKRQNEGARANRAADVVVLACAASAGAHAGLVPEHVRETPQLGAAFIVSVVLLLAAAAALALRPESVRASQAAALLLAGLIAAYAASRSIGIPWLEARPEAFDAVGLTTKLVEGLGVVFALRLSRSLGGHRPPRPLEVTR